MKIVCDSCGTKYSISDDKVRGKVFKIRCKKCSHIIVVRGGERGGRPRPRPRRRGAPKAAGTSSSTASRSVRSPTPTSAREIERGEIKADTYMWKEGFADWLKLSAVPEFAALGRRGRGRLASGGDLFAAGAVRPRRPTARERSRRPSRRGRSLFGGGGGGDSDVFAAPAAAAPRRGGDLFGSASGRAGLRASRAGRPRARRRAGHDGGRVENLTGQRHENSVLFSLSNLQSLAMPSAKPVDDRVPSTGADDRRLGPDRHSRHGGQHARPVGVATVPTSAAMRGRRSAGVRRVLAGGARAAADAASRAARPSGSTWSSSACWPGRRHRLHGVRRVISPKQAVRRRSRCRGARARAGAVEDGRREDAGAERQEADDDRREESAAARRRGRQGSQGEGKDGKDAKESRAPQGKRQAATRESPKKAAAAVKRRRARPRSRRSRSRRGRSRRDRSTICSNGATQAAAATVPRCRTTTRRAAAAATRRPDRCRRPRVVAGMNASRPKIAACYNQFKVPGMAMVNVVIGKNGKVTIGDVTGKFAGTPTGACVEKAVKSASFPPSDGPLDAVPVPAEVAGSRATARRRRTTRRSSRRSTRRARRAAD